MTKPEQTRLRTSRRGSRFRVALLDGGKWQISTDGGDWPVWNPAGSELFYRSPTGVMALAFETEPTFTRGSSPSCLNGTSSS